MLLTSLKIMTDICFHRSLHLVKKGFFFLPSSLSGKSTLHTETGYCRRTRYSVRAEKKGFAFSQEAHTTLDACSVLKTE